MCESNIDKATSEGQGLSEKLLTQADSTGLLLTRGIGKDVGNSSNALNDSRNLLL